MERFVCIHGHFYQPPRENPWLEYVEVQDSAYPFHDWNERVTAECYAPNASARILDEQGYISTIVDNYACISFNFGPTLLAWMESKAPEVYAAVLEADRRSMERNDGHGSALAQVYGHIIMPLANARDQETQVMWGIRDFQARFGRDPEGMWLAETAVDVATLECLAKHGIRFTILAPHQAAQVRRIDESNWHDVRHGRIDPTRPYQVNLPSGRSIAIFFYDGPISRAVAFEGTLSSGEGFARRLVSAFDGHGERPQLVHIATDGETYGHHHRHGEMALAYALRYIEEHQLGRVINYGAYLARFPPTHEATIVEDTSWSCVHGVERWRSDCGCSSGAHPGWNQGWRAPLRDALDWLRETLTPPFEAAAGASLRDPWAARDGYIDVILDRDEERVSAFLRAHGAHELNEDEQILALKLMEMQRHLMLMYTSCGWFFDDLAGIETVQVIVYAGRAIQLAEELGLGAFESAFLDHLREARSNDPAHRDGALIYEQFVTPLIVDLYEVGAHYALASLFDHDEKEARVYCYEIDVRDYERLEAGRAKLAVAQAHIRSQITWDEGALAFAALHLGDHNLIAGVREFQGSEAYEKLVRDLTHTFSRADFPRIIRLIDQHFGEETYALSSLFRDEQRRIIDVILDTTLLDAERDYRRIHEDNAALIRYLVSVDAPVPAALRTAAEFVMNVDLQRAFSADHFDPEYVQRYFQETLHWGLHLDVPGLSLALEQAIEHIAARVARGDSALSLLERLGAAIQLAEELPFTVDLWTTQNDFYTAMQTHFADINTLAERGDPAAIAWVARFRRVGEQLRVRVP